LGLGYPLLLCAWTGTQPAVDTTFTAMSEYIFKSVIEENFRI